MQICVRWFFLRRVLGLAVRALMASSTHPGSNASGLQRNARANAANIFAAKRPTG
jgi:hypothetical protein